MMDTLIDLWDDLPSAAKRRLLLGWIPILLVIILLCIFGGLPPTSWGLTLRLMAMSDALKDVPASTVSSFMNTLLIQSVCLLIAWLLIILAIVSELFAFKSLQTQVRISRLQAKLASSSTGKVQSPPAGQVQSSPTPGSTASPTMALPAPGLVAAPTIALPAPGPVVSSVTPPPEPPTAILNYSGARVTIDNTPDDYPANPFVSKTAEARSKSTKNQGVKISADSESLPDPFAVQDDALDLFGDDKEDNSSSRARKQSTKPEPDAKPELEEAVEQGPVFVYGDPFEGDLPEVFTYDKDLQKAVESLRNTSDMKKASGDKDTGTQKIEPDEPEEKDE